MRLERSAVEAACSALEAAERSLIERGGSRPPAPVPSLSGIGDDIDAALVGVEASRRSLVVAASTVRGALAALLVGLSALDRGFGGGISGSFGGGFGGGFGRAASESPR